MAEARIWDSRGENRVIGRVAIPCASAAAWPAAALHALAYTDRLAAMLPPRDHISRHAVWVETHIGGQRVGALVPVMTEGNAEHRARALRGLAVDDPVQLMTTEQLAAVARGGAGWRHVLATPVFWAMACTLDEMIHILVHLPRVPCRMLRDVEAALRRWRAGLRARLEAFLCAARRLGFPGVLVRDLLAPHVLRDLADVDARLATIKVKIGLNDE